MEHKHKEDSNNLLRRLRRDENLLEPMRRVNLDEVLKFWIQAAFDFQNFQAACFVPTAQHMVIGTSKATFG